MSSGFFSMIARMKYIARWGLMRSARRETLAEHSLDVAVIAHALAVIKNTRFGGRVDADRIAVLAMYHDCSEILTGDLPTPVKYYNEDISRAYHQVENSARDRLMHLLPADLSAAYEPLVLTQCDEPSRAIIKAADKISALLKCMEERSLGNTEFVTAEASTRLAIEKMAQPEANVFITEFLPGYLMTLDELTDDQ